MRDGDGTYGSLKTVAKVKLDCARSIYVGSAPVVSVVWDLWFGMEGRAHREHREEKVKGVEHQ